MPLFCQERSQATSVFWLRTVRRQRGNRMTPTYATKNGVRYRYYVSSALFEGQHSEAGKLKRIPAAEFEKLIATAIRSRLQIGAEEGTDGEVILTHVLRMDVAPESSKSPCIVAVRMLTQTKH